MFSSTKKCLLIKGEKYISEKTALSNILPSIIHICLNAYLRDGDLIGLQYLEKKLSEHIGKHLGSITKLMVESRLT